ncbi:MAG: FitA-like ribbon-helix-helix domain-containing protein [Terriglobales bacterium]
MDCKHLCVISPMAQFVVRNIENIVKVRLQRRARRHGHSMEEEAREISSAML